MDMVKDTRRALVRIGYDGRVHKTFRGHQAQGRFENECRVLKFLEEKGCPFVPRLLVSDPKKLYICTTNCGRHVDHLPEDRITDLFKELEKFGVTHDDPFLRNVTYRISDGRFCVIDFELATIKGDPNPFVADKVP
jgi:tRNA A-37 threonylcarbamoyl transferase component Bud32